MCGIVGGVGVERIKDFLLQGLRRLEYRGYDSAGMALVLPGRLEVYKAVGMISNLERAMEHVTVDSAVGIAHTRWATHGAPTVVNAHPHLDGRDEIAIVHNGIVENHDLLREQLRGRGFVFRSETDSEVIAHLIAFHYRDNVRLEEATRLALQEVRGTFGLVVASAREPDVLIAARMGSPLVIGVGEGCNVVASDVAAILSRTRQAIFLEDGEIARLEANSYTITDLDRAERNRSAQQLDMQLECIELGMYPHFMLKEIFEQPKAIENTCRGRLIRGAGDVKLGGLAPAAEQLKQASRLILCGCGTAWHAGLVGEYYMEELAGIPTEVEYASELRYRNPLIRPGRDVGVFITQSGETADTLAALRELKLKGATVLGICNVVGGSIPRETDAGIYTHAGPEIGVASTKAFTTQVLALLMMALYLGRRRRLAAYDVDDYVEQILALPEAVRRALQTHEQVKQIADSIADARNCLYLGRGYNFPIALEGALKMKEISYIHAEGYPAAEMKHGPIALIDKDMPVVVIATRDRVYAKILSNIEEVRSRGGRVIAVATEGDKQIRALAEQVIYVPEVSDVLSPLVTVVPLQLLAYYCALARGCNVDKPRNLAKSVTVE